MTACPNCHESTCLTLNPETLITPGILLDCERAKSARLESEIAAASQRTGEAENRRDDWNRLYVEAIGQRDAERASADAALHLCESYFDHKRECLSRSGMGTDADFCNCGFKATVAHINAIVKSAPSTALARVQALVEALRTMVAECPRCIDGKQIEGPIGRGVDVPCDLCSPARAALDAFTGTKGDTR